MFKASNSKIKNIDCSKRIWLVIVIIIALAMPFNIFCQSTKPVRPNRKPVPVDLPDSIPLTNAVELPAEVVADSIDASGEEMSIVPVDSFTIINDPTPEFFIAEEQKPEVNTENLREFTPDPIRAVWLSALFPGLGQAYNRRFWKLPIVVAGFMGLAYGTSWNNMMLRDYTRAYSDIMDNDPNTNSYMDFFPPTIQESDLDKSWLQNLLKRRKDYYRRNRDLCIISMVGVYLLAMVDAYVDASLAHFDISPDLSMDVAPAVIRDARHRPGIGLQWAFTF